MLHERSTDPGGPGGACAPSPTQRMVCRLAELAAWLEGERDALREPEFPELDAAHLILDPDGADDATRAMRTAASLLVHLAREGER